MNHPISTTPPDDIAAAQRLGNVTAHISAALHASAVDGYARIGDVLYAVVVEWERDIAMLRDEPNADQLRAYVAELRQLGRRIATAEVGAAWLPLDVAADIVEQLGTVDERIVEQWGAAGILSRLIELRAHASLGVWQRSLAVVAMSCEWSRWAVKS